MKLVTFLYEGPIGTVIEEGGFGASDIILIDDRTDAASEDWWEGKSLHKIVDEMGAQFPKDDHDTIIPKAKITIEVLGE